jgi:hypothetical protein
MGNILDTTCRKNENTYFIFNNFILRDEVTGEWRRLHNKELYALSPHQISFG